MQKKIIWLLGSALGLVFGFEQTVMAYSVEQLTNVPIENDFVLAGGKIELIMDKGETAVKEIMITNRLGKAMNFTIEVEDFEGSQSAEETVVFLGGGRGPYSLKDYVSTELKEFALDHGQRIIIPVTVAIPPDAEPGGRYGAVLVSANPLAKDLAVEKDSAKGQIKIITRLASLFFVKVKGEVFESGYIKEFKTSKKFYEYGPAVFQIMFANDGKIHLKPYGKIEIYNFMGKKIDEVEVDPWFSMPGSLRFREIKWDRPFLAGWYTAKAQIHRGYGDIIDNTQTSFLILPWKILLLILAAIIILVLFFKWVASHFELRRR